MSMAKRLDDLKDRSLTPQEAVIVWMQEAHQFGSFVDYGRWLAGQPDEAYPLIRMPEQVVRAIRAKNKGVPGTELRDQFLAVQRDLLFLYYLHSRANMRASSDHEPLSLRVIMLIREIRALTLESYGLDDLRRGRMGMEAGVQKRPGKKEREARDGYRGDSYGGTATGPTWRDGCRRQSRCAAISVCFSQPGISFPAGTLPGMTFSTRRPGRTSPQTLEPSPTCWIPTLILCRPVGRVMPSCAGMCSISPVNRSKRT